MVGAAHVGVDDAREEVGEVADGVAGAHVPAPEAGVVVAHGVGDDVLRGSRRRPPSAPSGARGSGVSKKARTSSGIGRQTGSSRRPARWSSESSTMRWARARRASQSCGSRPVLPSGAGSGWGVVGILGCCHRHRGRDQRWGRVGGGLVGGWGSGWVWGARVGPRGWLGLVLVGWLGRRGSPERRRAVEVRRSLILACGGAGEWRAPSGGGVTGGGDESFGSSGGAVRPSVRPGVPRRMRSGPSRWRGLECLAREAELFGGPARRASGRGRTCSMPRRSARQVSPARWRQRLGLGP